MNRKIFVISALCFLLFMSILFITDIQIYSPRDKQLYEYIDKATDYQIVGLKHENGIILLELLVETPKLFNEDYIQLESKILLDAIKKYPRPTTQLEDVIIRFISKDRLRIAVIRVSGKTINDHEWAKMNVNEVHIHVDQFFIQQ